MAAILAGCNEDSGRTSREVMINNTLSERLSATTRTFDVFIAVGGCDLDGTASVEVIESSAAVVLRGSVESTDDNECTADLRLTQRAVELAAPLGTRSITDDETGAVLYPD